jgi:thiazole synthase ThiGH ThiG subunit
MKREAMSEDSVIAGRVFRSRLTRGTGRHLNRKMRLEAVKASGTKSPQHGLVGP